jgi:hypothetical protein
MSESHVQWQNSGAKSCGNCFYFSLKGVSSLAPCGTCRYNKDNLYANGTPFVGTYDRWVTDSDQFWKDADKKMTESYEKDALRHQVAGDHYKQLEIQPIEFCHKNKLGPCESNIVKYITRWKDKGGKADLEKVKHYVDLLIQLEGL